MKYFYLLFTLICFISFGNSFAQENKQNKISSPLGVPSYTNLNINNISTFFFNNGLSDNTPDGNSGFYFPKGSNKTAVFMSGFLWGAKIIGDPQPRVGGSAYRSGIRGGKIISPGVAENPDAEHVRIYRVRPDVYPGGPLADLSSEVNDEGETAEDIRFQYEKDWTEWRAVDGAPFEDKNANGNYEPNIDIPGVPGADQTIWFVANDLDSMQTKFLHGALPLGIELQVTIWAYKSDAFLNNLFFRKYKMINKSSTTLNDVYVTMWNDVDLGYAGDDFAGCDTILNLGYIYNAKDSDDVYYPLPPPAIGYDLIKGPNFNNGTILPMTAFYYFSCSSDPNFGYPPQGEIAGSTEFYNFMQGKFGVSGLPFINPINGNPTSFALSGDPITQTGWVDGMGVNCGDRYGGLASGPFQMAVGDTQEIVIAQIAALGTDRLNSLTLLKDYSVLAKNFYDTKIVTIGEQVDINLTSFVVFQNYPNPFNPATKIRYYLPEANTVKIEVFNILGQRVIKLLDEEIQSGFHEVNFDGSSLASGIYIYTIEVKDRLFEAKKMLLLK